MNSTYNAQLDQAPEYVNMAPTRSDLNHIRVEAGFNKF